MYLHILTRVADSLWAIEHHKFRMIAAALAHRASGQRYSDDEIHARLSAGDAATPVRAGRGVAVIPIHGIIAHRMSGMSMSSGGASTEAIGKMVDQAAADSSIGTILYDINSPGGTVTGVPELAAKMFALRGQKRQVAAVNGMAASGAYWLAAQADEIVSMPTGMAGSIGVFSSHADLSKALEQEGVNITLISAGKFKTEGNQFGPLSDEARDVMQARVDAAYDQFVRDVARGRGTSVDEVRSRYGAGRVLTGHDAKKDGLVDRIETIDATIARLTAARSRDGVPVASAAHPQRTLGERCRYDY